MKTGQEPVSTQENNYKHITKNKDIFSLKSRVPI